MAYQIRCRECGKAFDTTSRRQIYCSHKCRHKAMESRDKGPVYDFENWGPLGYSDTHGSNRTGAARPPDPPVD